MAKTPQGMQHHQKNDKAQQSRTRTNLSPDEPTWECNAPPQIWRPEMDSSVHYTRSACWISWFPCCVFHICNFDICHETYKYKILKIRVSWVGQSTNVGLDISDRVSDLSAESTKPEVKQARRAQSRPEVLKARLRAQSAPRLLVIIYSCCQR